MAIDRVCGKCALMQHSGGICPIFNQTFSPEEPGCPKFTTELSTCEICHHLMLRDNTFIDATENTLHFVCGNCAKHFGHCATCKSSGTCQFEADPSPIPKMINQEVRQGNMISVMTVKNPSRIEITCKKGCKCFDAEFGCLRQNNSCGNYRIVYGE